MTPSITYLAVHSDVDGAVTIASTLDSDALDRRRLTSGEVLVQGFLQFAAKNGINTTASARHASALQAALNLSSFDDKGHAAATRAAPEGWVLVPAKPTREWIGAVADDGYADCDVAQMIASILSHAPAAPAAVARPVVAYRISDPNEPDIGHWLSDEPGAAWCKSEPLVFAPTTAAPVHPDDAAVDALAARMKAKLAKQRAKGYGGWDTLECTQQRLSDMLREHVAKGDPVDVANFCAFLSARGEGIAKAPAPSAGPSLTFDQLRQANVTRCLKWHPQGLSSWSPSDWLTAAVGELGELASEVKTFNRERDGLVGNKQQYTPAQRLERMAKEAADAVTYIDLFCAERGIDLGAAVVSKFNEVSERVGFPDRLVLTTTAQGNAEQCTMDARHASIYRWIIRNVGAAAAIIDAWREDSEADKDELHGALAAKAAREGGAA